MPSFTDRSAVTVTEVVFSFAEDFRARAVLLLLGVTPGRSSVVVDDSTLRVRFGPWSLETPLANVAGTTVTGPFRFLRAVGIRVSLVDRGVTFGSSPAAGVCLQLREPVSLRLGRLSIPLKHPGVTVTVAEPQALASRMAAAGA